MIEVEDVQEDVLEPTMRGWRTKLADIAPGFVPALLIKTAIVSRLADVTPPEASFAALEDVIDAGTLGAAGVRDAVESLRGLGVVTVDGSLVRLNEGVLE